MYTEKTEVLSIQEERTVMYTGETEVLPIQMKGVPLWIQGRLNRYL